MQIENVTARQAIIDGLPPLVVQLVNGGDFKGGMLLRLTGDEGSDEEVGLADLERNFWMLKAILQACGDRVPGAFQIADSFLVANELLNGKLLRNPDTEEQKEATHGRGTRETPTLALNKLRGWK